MGRRKKSAEVIAALGNSGGHSKASLREREAASVDVAKMIEAANVAPIGDAPDWLGATGRKAWEIAAPALKAINLLSEPDRIAFARYCSWLAEYFDLEKAKPKRARAVKTTTSRAVKMDRIDRGFLARLQLDKRLIEYEDRFGMTPAARNAIFAKLATGYQPANKGTQPGPGPTAGGNAEPKKTAGPLGFLKTSAESPRRLQ